MFQGRLPILLLMKKALIFIFLIATVTIVLWYQIITPEAEPESSIALVVPDSQPITHSQNTARQTEQSHLFQSNSHAARGLALARIEDQNQRDAALTEWISGFSCHEEIVKLISDLRKEPGTSAVLRALIAPHLTRQWAKVDGQACITSYLSEGGLYRRDPLDSNNNPFAAPDSATSTTSCNLFSLIAETNPTAFQNWLKSAPVDLIPSLLGDSAHPTWKAWAAADSSGEKHCSPDPVFAQDFHQSDFFRLIAANSPEILIRPVLNNDDLGLNRRYFSGLLMEFSSNGNFFHQLSQSFTTDQLWDILTKASDLGPDPDQHTSAAFQKLAQIEIAALPGTREERASSTVNMAPTHRQAATFAALLDSLDPSAGKSYWNDVNAIAKAINASSVQSDQVQEITLVNSYSDLRLRIARTLAKDNIDEALEWIGSIRDQRNRASCLMQIAAEEIKPGVRAWASGEIGAEGSNETINLHFEDRSANPPRVDQFTMPAQPAETFPQYYNRLRSTLQQKIEAHSPNHSAR